MSRPDAARDLRRDIDDLLMVLRDARRLLEAGALIDLGGVDGRVAECCRALGALAPSEAEPYLPDLAAIAEELAALEAECRRRREALDVPAGPARSDLNRAARAYARPLDPDD